MTSIGATVAMGLSLMLGVAALPTPAQALNAGDWVLGRFNNGPYWFPGVAVRVSGDQVTVKYDDGDSEILTRAHVRPYTWKVGTRVECNFKGGGDWYAGRITALESEKLSIAYDDGDRERTTTGRCRSK